MHIAFKKRYRYSYLVIHLEGFIGFLLFITKRAENSKLIFYSDNVVKKKKPRKLAISDDEESRQSTTGEKDEETKIESAVDDVRSFSSGMLSFIN